SRVRERLHEARFSQHYEEVGSGCYDEAETRHRCFSSHIRIQQYAVRRISAVEDRFDFSQQTQYAAETFQLPDGTLLVAFRGTDDSRTGWREDFNMAFTYPVPAQTQAADYPQKVGRLRPNAPIMPTGHSQVVTIAIYAAIHARDQTTAR
ncbi:UNVERIFIED_CONTAM: DUF2974 domain-containing protein, partial [Bifidobacterium animalis]